MILSKVTLEAIKVSEYTRGFNQGRAVNVIAEEGNLAVKQKDLAARVRALEGSVLLAKALVEQLQIAGVPQWFNQR